MDKEAIKKQFLDKSKTFTIVIHANSFGGLNIVSQVNINISLDNTILDTLKIYLNHLNNNCPNYVFDELNIIKDMNIHVHVYGRNITNIDKKIKLHTFECTRPIMTVYFPNMIQLQLKTSPHIYIFNANDFIQEAEKFLKKKIGIDLSKYIYDNKKTIPLNERFNSIFKSHTVNTLTLNSEKSSLGCIASQPFLSSGNCAMNGSIYLIRTREFLNQNVPIYKIGKTSNHIADRLGKYGKGGEVIFTIAVPLSKLDSVELDLIKSFKNKFIQKQDIGTEYFEGNHIEMMKYIFDKCFPLNHELF